MSHIVSCARLFAIAAHEAVGQVRKGTGAPYIEHPEAVAGIVRSVPHTDEMLAAAWLHDVVEDTGVELATIVREFGPVVGRLVEELTDVSSFEDGNRAARKAIDLAHTALASPAGKTIKLADIIHNCQAIHLTEPGFAPVWLAEKALLLEVLQDGDPVLLARAREVL